MNSLTRSLWRSRTAAALLIAVLAAVSVGLSAQEQPVASSNINMVSGTTFPDGDPYLQRQNEPNAAVSTRNPLHLLAGANDYRTVDCWRSDDYRRDDSGPRHHGCRIRDGYGGRRISGELPVSRTRRESWPADSTAAPWLRRTPREAAGDDG